MNRAVFEVRNSRRALIGGALGLAGAAGLSRVAGAQDGSPEAGWAYTDVLDEMVELAKAPQRVVAAIENAAALWDFGVRPVAVFGWAAVTYPDGDHFSWGRIDPSMVDNVGTPEAAAIDVEKLISVDPDLIVSWIWDKGSPDVSIVGIPAEVVGRIEQTAPIVILTQGDSNSIELSRVERLAVALGADLESPELVEQRAGLRASEDAVRALVQEKPDRTVLFASFNPDGFYVAGPDFVGELGYARELGLSIANDGAPGSNQYWEEISPEQALMYPADVIYIDQYGAWTTLEQLQAHATLAVHPAIAAGQVAPWDRDLPLSYIGQNEFLNKILEPLTTAEKVS